MIFVTIGTQEPFDRLIKAIDEIAPLFEGLEVVAQTANTAYHPQNINTKKFIPPREFEEYFSKATLIVAHAGMGTIISALSMRKPIVVMPRLASLGEHRNDHQLATAKRFELMNYINVAYEEQQLYSKITESLYENFTRGATIGEHASKELTDSIKEFILL